VGICVGAYLLSVVVRGGASSTPADGWVKAALDLAGTALCFARAITLRFKRGSLSAVALVLGASLAAWTAGDVAVMISSAGVPLPPFTPDYFWLAFYPFAFGALIMFLAVKLHRLSPAEWLDTIIAGSGAAAVCAAFAFNSIQLSAGYGPTTILNLAYPIGDVMLLGLVAAGFAVMSKRRDTSWMLLGLGMLLTVPGDTANLFSQSFGATPFGSTVNAISWPAAILVMSLSVWVRQRPVDLLETQPLPSFLMPTVATAAALVIFLVGYVQSIGRVPIALAAVTLALVGARMVLSVSHVRRMSDERHFQSLTDELTSLANRRRLFQVLDGYFSQLGRSEQERSLAFLYVDLDRFKEVNDSFGHAAGDELLRRLGERLSGSLRENDLLVRLGGDEFGVVLVDRSLEYAMVVATRVAELLTEPFNLSSIPISVGASIGIAMAPVDARSSSELLWCADVAMYRAKVARLPFACFQQEVDGERDQMRMLVELRSAIHLGQLVLHYQPQLDLHRRDIRSVEALVRWNHPRLGMLPPAQFIELAEEGGLMPAMTEWVLGEATRQCAEWRSDGHHLTIAVNVTPETLLKDGLIPMVVEALRRHDLPAQAVVIEMTERCVVNDFERTRHVVQELRSLGVTVSIDDFGAGATSLAYLSNLAVGELKLDRTFINGHLAEDRSRDQDIIRSTIELGHSVGVRVVAEGIEDKETLKLISDLGCDLAQGYWIGKPKSAVDMTFGRALAA
jgi:diguanylate cyclase (GGDEF)-like protein